VRGAGAPGPVGGARVCQRPAASLVTLELARSLGFGPGCCEALAVQPQFGLECGWQQLRAGEQSPHSVKLGVDRVGYRVHRGHLRP
jgi:hypothetical protein